MSPTQPNKPSPVEAMVDRIITEHADTLHGYLTDQPDFAIATARMTQFFDSTVRPALDSIITTERVNLLRNQMSRDAAEITLPRLPLADALLADACEYTSARFMRQLLATSDFAQSFPTAPQIDAASVTAAGTAHERSAAAGRTGS